MVKYNADQIQVAVQHYLNHDRCIGSSLRALWYPCRELLIVCVRPSPLEFVICHRLLLRKSLTDSFWPTAAVPLATIDDSNRCIPDLRS